jgi:hypothetical protein
MVVTHQDNFLLFFVLPAVVAYLAAVFATLRRLQTDHVEVWRALGAPSGLNMSIKNSWLAGRYIVFRGDYYALGDSKLNHLVWITRVLWWFTGLEMVLWAFGIVPSL